MERPLLLVVVAVVVQTIGAVVYQSLGVVAPFLVSDLGLTAIEFGLIPSAMHVGSLAALVFGAMLIERHGPVRLLGYGALVCAGSLVVGAVAASYLVLVATLIVVGAVWGLSAIAGGQTIILSVPTRRRATVTSLRQLALPVGGFIAAAAAPLAVLLGWHGLLLLEAGAFALAAAYILRSRLLPGHRRRRSGWLQFPTRRGAVLGILAIGLTAGQASFLVYAVLELTGRLELPFEAAAALYLGGQGVGAAYRALLGVISDAVPMRRTRLLALNSVAAGVAAFGFGQLTPGAPAWLLVPTVLGAAGLIIGWNGVLVVAILEAAEPVHLNRNLSAGMTLMRIGIIVGPPVFGLVLTVFGSGAAWTMVAMIFIVIAAGFARLRPGFLERRSLEEAAA